MIPHYLFHSLQDYQIQKANGKGSEKSNGSPVMITGTVIFRANPIPLPFPDSNV
jgi:hypothetical protein